MGDTMNDNRDIDWSKVLSDSEYEKLPDEIKKKHDEDMKKRYQKMDEIFRNWENDEYGLENYTEDFEPLLKK